MNRGRGLKTLMYPYMEGGSGGRFKNRQNHPYVINEWARSIQQAVKDLEVWRRSSDDVAVWEEPIRLKLGAG